MKFLLDETVSTFVPLLEKVLREKEYNVTSMSTVAPGTHDLDVLQVATEEGRTIITHDSDFSEYKFRDNLYILYRVIFIEESKYQVNRLDPLYTRKIGSAIDHIVAQVANGEYNCDDAIFTITQPTPYGPVGIRPKKEKHKREVATGVVYIEEQLEITDRVVITSNLSATS